MSKTGNNFLAVALPQSLPSFYLEILHLQGTSFTGLGRTHEPAQGLVSITKLNPLAEMLQASVYSSVLCQVPRFLRESS